MVEKLIEVYEDEALVKVYKNMCRGRRELVSPEFAPMEDIMEAWSEEEYDHWEIGETITSEIYTNRNERVRSKSEKIIADELDRYGIPYKYEYPLQVTEWGRERTVRPDFLAMNRRTGRVFVIEHLGMMDNADYVNDSMTKLGIYEKNGYLLGKNLLIFHESLNQPLNTGIVNKYIQEYLI